jgi:acyl-CoA synthetase (AMP-forming)/AMP-acid ligase II
MLVRPPRTIGRILDLAALNTPTRVAVSLQDEHRTFGECDRAANRTARALQRLGLKRGDRLLFWSPVTIDSFDVFFATQRLGVAFVPVNFAFSAEEVAPLIEYVRPSLLLAEVSLAPQAEALAKAAGIPVATIGGRGPGHDIDAMSSAESDAPIDVFVDDEDIHAIFLTSGSTGRPKGVMVSHRASWFRALGGNSRVPASGGRGEANMFPLFHWAGWHFSLCAWIHGRAIHLTPRADADALNAIIDRWKPRYMYGIPAIWERLLESPGFGKTQSLRLIGTGTYRVELTLIEALRERLPGVEMTIGWGSTELGVGTQICEDDIDAHPYSVGIACPGVELGQVDGELIGRSDSMMSGYFELPEQTAEVLKDGWYYTGDLGEFDEEGYISIVGRRREIIRSAAESIAPAEVEAAIVLHPSVREVSVVGLPDQSWGERVCAVLVLNDGADAPSIDELRKFVTPHLAAFKHPREIVLMPALPRTSATGQIQRSRIRDVVLEMKRQA